MKKDTFKFRVGHVELTGDLSIPAQAVGLVIFSHGSGSGRLSPRNQAVAETLNEVGLATLLFDLLSEEESMTVKNRFDIPLLAERLEAATDWVSEMPGVVGLPTGYFGASTGAASALKAAAARGNKIKAVVSRGGRPDLALEDLPAVTAAVQLVIGEKDREVIAMNQTAFQRLRGPKEMVIVKGATHLFEEPGTLEMVAQHAVRWFGQYLKFTTEEEMLLPHL